MNSLRRALWRLISRYWNPPNWRFDALHYAREWWPEELLMQKIFRGWKRFLRPSWWWLALLVWTLPPNEN